MISNVDQLLLDANQQTAIKRLKTAYENAYRRGDTAAMNQAHAQAEAIRASAGYSGGAGGDEYRLLQAASAPAGFGGYEHLLREAANGGMQALAGGYVAQANALSEQRKALLLEGAENQAAARSAVWNQQRLAQEGLLTRGLSRTGMADVLTATALNQASENAYRALLDRQNDLAENAAAQGEVKAEALKEAADLRLELGSLLGNAYRNFYGDEADRRAELEQMEKDYYYQLALQRLKLQSK